MQKWSSCTFTLKLVKQWRKQWHSHWLETVVCILSAIYCWLSTDYYLLSTVFCLFSFVFCLMSTVYCLLSNVYCLLSTVYCLLSTVYSFLVISLSLILYCTLQTTWYGFAKKTYRVMLPHHCHSWLQIKYLILKDVTHWRKT